jgi:hypothetical protein
MNLLDYYDNNDKDSQHVFEDNNGTKYYYDLVTRPNQESQYIWARDAENNIFPIKMDQNNYLFTKYTGLLKSALQKNQDYYDTLRQ